MHVFDSLSGSEDSSGGDEYSEEDDKDEDAGNSSDSNDKESDDDDDEELATADRRLHNRQNSDYYRVGQLGKMFEVDGVVWLAWPKFTRTSLAWWQA